MGRSRSPRAAGRSPHVPVPAGSTQGVEYRALPPGSPETRSLFAYAAVWAPPPCRGEIGWGAWATADSRERMIGALVVERGRAAGMIHGPVVVETEDPLEVATQLLARALPQAATSGLETVFARPQGLERVWVRFGFIPVPEADLPQAFKGRPGTGLFGWRGGSALWTSRRPDAIVADDPR